VNGFAKLHPLSYPQIHVFLSLLFKNSLQPRLNELKKKLDVCTQEELRMQKQIPINEIAGECMAGDIVAVKCVKYNFHEQMESNESLIIEYPYTQNQLSLFWFSFIME
jgi:hypothetical protein